MSVRHMSTLAPVGIPYGTPSTVLYRLVLQVIEDVRVVRDQVEVHRRDVAPGDEPSDALPEADTPSY